MTRLFYAEEPKRLELLEDGSTAYRWDVKKEEDNGYSCFEARVFGAVTKAKVTERVLGLLYGDGVEQKLINDYNASALGLLPEEYKQRYLDFLEERKNIKSDIQSIIG